jgi:hypothetical protein
VAVGAVLPSLQMRTLVLVALVAGLGTAGTVAVASSQRASFADGRWRGTAKLTTTIQGVKLVANASFTMRVTKGKVTGTLTETGTATGTVEGSKLSAKMNGRYAITGTAAKPRTRGKLTISATVDGQPQTLPADVIQTFTVLRGTCNRMGGKLTLAPAKPDPTATGPQTLSSAFVATRTPGSGPSC